MRVLFQMPGGNKQREGAAAQALYVDPLHYLEAVLDEGIAGCR